MNDRLLNEQDCQRIFADVYGHGEAELVAIHDFIAAIASAQLAKADKEWVEWLETNLFHETDYGLEFNCLSKFALVDWQERKKEMGYEC